MASDGAVEGFAVGKAAEMERGAPAVLVYISGKVVVAVEKFSLQPSTREMEESKTVLSSQSSIFVSSGLPRLLCLDVGGFVVPMLEILINSSFLGGGVFVPHGRKTISVDALSMESFVESRIPLEVFLLETRGNCGRRHVEMAEVQLGLRIN
jgi:hypothetical protein